MVIVHLWRHGPATGCMAARVGSRGGVVSGVVSEVRRRVWNCADDSVSSQGSGIVSRALERRSLLAGMPLWELIPPVAGDVEKCEVAGSFGIEGKGL